MKKSDNKNKESILDKNEIASDKADANAHLSIEKIRPLYLDDFIGQEEVKNNLKVFIESAKKREKAMDHILFYGPPGLGKTTLAGIISHELGVGFKSSSAPMISKSGDLAAIITNLQPNDVLFIDEIHRLSPAIEEVLYSAMEDFTLDVIIGEGPSARSIKIELPPFTFVGATTRTGLLTNPLRDRFGIPIRMNFYNDTELSQIIKRAAKLLNIGITDEGAMEIAKRSRGTPRVANRLLKRIRDFAIVANSETITTEIASDALEKLQVDSEGLDLQDIQYMMCIIENYGGGPVGIETLAASMSESQDTIEEVIEPLHHPEEYQRYGITIPNGMLLYGPPGCGKTFFAKHFAEEVGFNFMFITPATLKSRYVNASQENIAKMFKEAEENAPTIIFIDEINELVPNREENVHEMSKSAVNEMLAQMDRTGEKGIFIIGATNYPHMIDPAILRAGRLDKKYYVGVPDEVARKTLFELYLKNRPYDFGLDYDELSILTKNYVSADIQLIVNNAARTALKSRSKITMAILRNAIAAVRPSLDIKELQRYEEIKAQMNGENIKKSENRPKVGFK